VQEVPPAASATVRGRSSLLLLYWRGEALLSGGMEGWANPSRLVNAPCRAVVPACEKENGGKLNPSSRPSLGFEPGRVARR
jgi:hypothetical protein